MRKFLHFWWRCVVLAAKGNVAFANNWMWLLGVPIFSTILAYAASRRSVTTVTTGSTVLDLLLTGAGSFAATWATAFLVRLINAPVRLYHEQKERADHFEQARQLSNSAHKPSFALGFEMSPVDEEEIDSYLRAPDGMFGYFRDHPICRIWVENTDPTPIHNCRLVIEEIWPTSLINNGALLVPDNDKRTTTELPIFNLGDIPFDKPI